MSRETENSATAGEGARPEEGSQGETTTPQQWESIRVFLRDLPSADAISRNANSIEKEAQIVRELLSQALPLSQLFLALDEATRQGNKERVGQAGKAILRVFTSSVGPALLDDPIVLPNLNAGLQHPSPDVRKLTCRVLQKALQQRPNDDGLLDHLLQPGGSSTVPSSLALAVSDDDIGVGQHAADALVQLVQQEGGDRASVIMGLVRDAAGSDRVMGSNLFPLRYADLIARAISTSEASLSAAISTGAIEVLFRLVESRDALIQFSALELLDQVAQTSWGAAYLFRRSGAVGRLLTLATGKDDYLSAGPGGEPDPILGGTCLRVLGSLYLTIFSQQPQQQQQQGAVAGGGSQGHELVPASGMDPALIRAVLSTVLQYAESTRDSDRLSALQAICGFARGSPVALRLILDDPVLLSAWLDIRSMRTEMKAASLHSVAKVLRGRTPQDDVNAATLESQQQQQQQPETAAVGDQGGEEASELRKLLFARLGEVNTRAAGSTMAFLMGHLKTPIQPIRNAAYDVLAAAAEQRGGWGLRALFGHGGFLEMLMNRRTETTKEGKEWKFAVVEAAMRCPDKGILAQDLLEGLTKFLKEGPFYVGNEQAEVEAMMS